MSKEKIKVFTGSGSFNPGEDLQKQFVEDAPQQVNELANVENLSKFVIDLQNLESEIERDEKLLKDKKAQADKISGEVIPEIMEQMKLKTLKLVDGSAIEVKEVYSATIPVANRGRRLRNWLRAMTWVILLKMRLLFPLVVAKMTRLRNMLVLQKVKATNHNKS